MKILQRLDSYLLIFFGHFAIAQVARPRNRLIIDNVTVNTPAITGQTAILPCTVDPQYAERFPDLYKPLWSNPHDTAISLQDRRILNDDRMSVERPMLGSWNLHIRNVSLTDAGVYKCQINTKPVGTKLVRLIVKDPPSIIEYTHPSDIERPEGETVELFCNASGTPLPEITWYRLNTKGSGWKELVGQSGEVLVIRNISRICADTYECVADNDVPPIARHIFKISIQYAPEIHLPNTRIGQYLGKDTILECEINAVPLGSVVWKHNGRNLEGNMRHEVNLYNNMDDSVILSLRLQKITLEDFGEYQCSAENEQGVTTRTMVLYEIPSSKTSSTTTSTTPPPKIWVNGRRYRPTDEYEETPSGKILTMAWPGGVNNTGSHSIGRARGRQNGNHYRRPQVNSQGGKLGSGDSTPYRSRPTDGSSKYTGVNAGDRDGKDGGPALKFSVMTMTVSAVLSRAVAL